jgi:hypothetical protein
MLQPSAYDRGSAPGNVPTSHEEKRSGHEKLHKHSSSIDRNHRVIGLPIGAAYARRAPAHLCWTGDPQTSTLPNWSVGRCSGIAARRGLRVRLYRHHWT